MQLTYMFILAYLTVMLQTQILWVREIAAKADLMIYCIEDLMDGIQYAENPEDKARYDIILKTRFKRIIKQHHSMNEYVKFSE